MKPYIQIVFRRANGRVSSAKIAGGEKLSTDMVAVAEELLETLTTGERPPPKGLYEWCALAFGTTRAEAKKRLIGAAYGKTGKAVR